MYPWPTVMEKDSMTKMNTDKKHVLLFCLIFTDTHYTKLPQTHASQYKVLSVLNMFLEGGECMTK